MKEPRSGRVGIDVTNTNATELLSENHYYPFGMAYEGPVWINDATDIDNRYKYNEKEQLVDHGLGWYNYWARFYDPSVGRWSTPDPLSDLQAGYSPYHYVYDNPISYVDPFGLMGEGADGLTNEDWINASRPGADKNLYQEYRSQNKENQYYKDFFFNHLDKKYSEYLVHGGEELYRELVGREIHIYYKGIELTKGETYALGSVMSLATGQASTMDGLNDPIFMALTIWQSVWQIGKLSFSGLLNGASKANQPVVEGIYEFTAASGKTYVGQSSNIAARLEQHIASGKLLPGTPVKTIKVIGGKTVREIAEQLRINELGGLRNLENIRNPIGKARQYLLP